MISQTNPKLSKLKDDDERYPIHWAASSNNLEIVVMLANQPSFDPDVQVLPISFPSSSPRNIIDKNGTDHDAGWKWMDTPHDLS